MDCFQTKNEDYEANNKLSNMNVKKQRFRRIYSKISIFEQTQDL